MNAICELCGAQLDRGDHPGIDSPWDHIFENVTACRDILAGRVDALLERMANLEEVAILRDLGYECEEPR